MKTVLIWLISGSAALAQTIVPRTLVQLSVDHDRVYLAGEPIAGKTQIINALTGRPDSTDAALYIDCIDADRGTLLRRVIVRPRNGLARFTLTPPDSLPSYHCQLRAYTNWMRNFSTDAFGRQNLLVVSPTDQQRLSPSVTTASAPVSTVMVQAEGGALVAGLRNRLVFCARDTFGVGVPATGFILTSTGDTLTKLTTDNNGLASADISPLPQTAYRAVLGGKRVTLPPLQSMGSVLRCNDLTYPDRVRVTIENRLPTTPDTLTFIVQSRGRILSYASVPRQMPVSVFNIARSGLPSGLISLVLVDKQKKRVGERLIYNSFPANDDAAEPIDLQLDQPLPSLTPHQLSDALVLRQNTLFGWDELTADRTYTFPAERGISLSGQLAKWNDKAVGAPVMVSLIATPVGDDSLSQRELFVAQSDANGRFVFENMNLYGTYSGQLTAKIGNIDTRIRLDSSTVPPIVAQPKPIDWRILPDAQTLVARYDTLLTTRQRNTTLRGTTLQAVTVTANKTTGVQQAVFSTKPGTVVSRTSVLSNGVGGMLSDAMPRYLEYRLIKYVKPVIKYYIDDVLQQGRLDVNDIAVGVVDHIDIHERDADAMLYNADIVVAIYTIRSTNLTRKQVTKTPANQFVLTGFQRTANQRRYASER